MLWVGSKKCLCTSIWHRMKVIPAWFPIILGRINICSTYAEYWWRIKFSQSTIFRFLHKVHVVTSNFQLTFPDGMGQAKSLAMLQPNDSVKRIGWFLARSKQMGRLLMHLSQMRALYLGTTINSMYNWTSVIIDGHIRMSCQECKVRGCCALRMLKEICCK